MRSWHEKLVGPAKTRRKETAMIHVRGGGTGVGSENLGVLFSSAGISPSSMGGEGESKNLS